MLEEGSQTRDAQKTISFAPHLSFPSGNEKCATFKLPAKPSVTKLEGFGILQTTGVRTIQQHKNSVTVQDGIGILQTALVAMHLLRECAAAHRIGATTFQLDAIQA